MAVPDLSALYPATRTQEKQARERGLKSREELINFFSFLARPAKGAALMAGAIEPEQHPDYKAPIDPKYSYPYGTPKGKVASEEAMKFAEQIGFGTGNIGGIAGTLGKVYKGSQIVAQLQNKGYSIGDAIDLVKSQLPPGKGLFHILGDEAVIKLQKFADTTPPPSTVAVSKEQALVNLLHQKGWIDKGHLGKGLAEGKTADDLWYSLPTEIKGTHLVQAIKALDPASSVGEFSMANKILKPGERFPLIEKAIEISKAQSAKPAAYDPKMLQQPYAPGATKGEVIQNFIEQAGFTGAPKQADFAAKAPDLNELWAYMPPGVSSKAMKEALKGLGIPHSTEYGEWLNHVLQPGERMPIISAALDWQKHQNALTDFAASVGKPKPTTLTAPSIRKAKDIDPYDTQRQMKGVALSVTSGAHKLSEEAARTIGYNIPAFKGMRYFDPEKPGLMINPNSSEPAQFFTRRPLRVAAEYAGLERDQKYIPEWVDNSHFAPTILPVWLRSLNPLVVGETKKWMPYSAHKFAETLKRARGEGHDSVIFKNVSDVGGISNQYAVFDPSQIRSTSAAFKDWWSPNLMGARLVPPPPQQERESGQFPER